MHSPEAAPWCAFLQHHPDLCPGLGEALCARDPGGTAGAPSSSQKGTALQSGPTSPHCLFQHNAHPVPQPAAPVCLLPSCLGATDTQGKCHGPFQAAHRHCGPMARGTGCLGCGLSPHSGDSEGACAYHIRGTALAVPRPLGWPQCQPGLPRQGHDNKGTVLELPAVRSPWGGPRPSGHRTCVSQQHAEATPVLGGGSCQLPGYRLH